MNAFAKLGLPAGIVQTVTALGYLQPTPVQVQAIPALLAGRDLLAAAQTGTGKTAAFGLPLIARLLATLQARPARTVRALVLAPTRELAAQIAEALAAYSKGTALRCALVFGGVNIRPQIEALAQGVDILVATPGRLLDHAGQKTVDLSRVEALVLDEADRMLDMGFIHDIKKVLRLVPAQRMTSLFSATFPDEIIRLARELLTDPVTVEIARNKEVAVIEQEAWSVPKRRKRELLRDLIVDGAWEQVLVFTRMKHTANRLSEQLGKDGIVAAAIHSNKSQNARTKALAGFKERAIRVLVATDIAARGLDIEGLPHVVNFDLPNVAEDYVHRIGRTGRAGLAGHAVSLVCPEEAGELAAIEKLLKRRIALKRAEGYDGDMPEDIAADNAARDAARAAELKRMRESRRRARPQRQGAPERPPSEPVSSDPADRFEKRIVSRNAPGAAPKAPRKTAPNAAPNAAPKAVSEASLPLRGRPAPR
ncbi:MAG: DEAD/DEAH box helicase, partial [Duodenibacillus sp.]|nr:DEAD/DEAH box helicase [Duodenibacillus sp.]